MHSYLRRKKFSNNARARIRASILHTRSTRRNGRDPEGAIDIATAGRIR